MLSVHARTWGQPRPFQIRYLKEIDRFPLGQPSNMLEIGQSSSNSELLLTSDAPSSSESWRTTAKRPSRFLDPAPEEQDGGENDSAVDESFHIFSLCFVRLEIDP
jgi:hypothetical protein